MICKKCGKEVDGELLFCPYCGASMSSEDIPLIDDKVSSKEYKKYEQSLKHIERKYKRFKRYRVKANIVTFVLIICLIFGGVVSALFLSNKEEIRCQSEINKIAQEEKVIYAKYENEFANAVIQNREKQIKSCFVSSRNMESANDYIASLYRRPESRIETLSFMDKFYYLITDALRLDKYNLLDTTNNVIYPGAIIKGDSLFTGNYTVLATERTPIDLMSNQTDGKPVTILNPNYSNVTIALNQYAKDYMGNISKEWTYHLQSASTSQELNLVLGAGAGNVADFNIGINTNSQQSTVAVVYSQIYYTVSTEPKGKATDYFNEGVDLKVLGEYEPAYVSSVDYGRKIVLCVSGELSEEELSAKLSAHIKGVEINAGIENVMQDETLDCYLRSYGGEGTLSILKVSEKKRGWLEEINAVLWGDEDNSNNESIVDRLNDFLSDSSTLVNPVPISYSLKYLSDNTPVPAMYVKSETIFLAENAQLVNLSSTDNKEFTVDITALPAILLNKEDVLLQGTKATGSYFQLLCGACETLPASILCGNTKFSVDLAKYEMEKDIHIWIDGGDKNILKRWLGINEVYGIDIYKTQYLENVQ